MRKIYLLILMLPILAGSVLAQDKALLSAKEYFSKRDYVHAIKLYKKALRKSDNYKQQKTIAYKIALSYYNMNDYKSALDWFEDAAGDITDNNDLYLYYSETLSIEGRYEEAVSLLKKIENSTNDPMLIKQKIAGIELISKQKCIDTLHITKYIEALNTEFSEYGIACFGDKFVISSSRKEGVSGRMDGRTAQGFSNLFYTFRDEENNDWSNLRKLPGKFNTNENEGSFTYDSINQTAYWTRCTEKTDLCLIYLSHFNKFNKKWTKPEKAPFQISGFDYGHPFISNDGQTLLFTSNMSDGHGGKDIWKISRKNDGSWGIPVNLGEGVNTSGNEAFPAIYGDTLLFFSSDSHNSLGRYDIFFSLREGLAFKQSVNLGYPINSAADDYAIILDQSGKNGWFCSDRNLETSDDIYSFKGFPIKIVVQGKVLHELDNSPIANATIGYKDMDGNADSLKCNENGEYIIYINAFDNYRISASKDKYYTDYKSIDTREKKILFAPPPQKTVNFYLSKTQYPCAIKGYISNKESKSPMGGIKVEIYNKDGFSNWTYSDDRGIYDFDGLKPNTIYTIRTSNDGYFSESRVCNLPKVDMEKVFEKANGYDMDFELMKIQLKSEILLSNIYYDFNKSNLRETSKVELNKLASMLQETPAVVVQISSHTDEIGTESYNLRLSAERAQSVVDYLVMKGIDRRRLIAKGYGESRLLIKNAKTDEENQANRRTTFKVLEILGDKTSEIVNSSDEDSKIDYSDNSVEPDLVYRVQISSSSAQKDLSNSFTDVYQNINNVLVYENHENGLFKYEVGNALSFSGAKILQQKLKNIGYNDCFIIAYYKGVKISVSEALGKEKY